MNLNNYEYDTIIETLAKELKSTKLNLKYLTEARKKEQTELDRLRMERCEVERDLRAAEAEAKLIKEELEALIAKSAASDKEKAEKTHESGPCQQQEAAQ